MCKSYRSIFITILGTLLAVNVTGQWIKEQLPTTSNLNAIYLITDKSGWIVGDNGTMLFKNNDTWENSSRITDNNLFSITFYDQNEGWVVGSNGIILRYNGINWERYSSPTLENLYSVSFTDREHGIAVGSNGTLLIYENKRWQTARKMTRANLYTVSAKNDQIILGGGLENFNIPVMKVINNQEKTIVNTFDPGYVAINSITTDNRNNIWAVGRAGSIFYFNGSKWISNDQFDKLPSLNSVFFSEQGKGITVGNAGIILSYSPTGWVKETSPTKNRLNGAYIYEGTYYAVGNQGTLVTSANITTGLESPGEKIKSIIIKAYPNPSTEYLNIVIPCEEGFTPDFISVTNASGNVVFREKLDMAYCGQVYRLNTLELKNGLYVIELSSTGKKSASCKFIVSRER